MQENESAHLKCGPNILTGALYHQVGSEVSLRPARLSLRQQPGPLGPRMRADRFSEGKSDKPFGALYLQYLADYYLLGSYI